MNWCLPLHEGSAVATVPHGDQLGQDRQRDLLGAARPDVEADRRVDTGQIQPAGQLSIIWRYHVISGFRLV